MAGGEEPLVLFPSRHTEAVGNQRDELRAGAGLTEFDEAQVARRHTSVESEIELATPSAHSTFADEWTHTSASVGSGHQDRTYRRTIRDRVPDR
jgi:hypothetical protein